MKIKSLKGSKRHFKGSKGFSSKIKAFKGFKGSLKGLQASGAIYKTCEPPESAGTWELPKYTGGIGRHIIKETYCVVHP